MPNGRSEAKWTLSGDTNERLRISVFDKRLRDLELAVSPKGGGALLLLATPAPAHLPIRYDLTLTIDWSQQIRHRCDNH